MDISHDIFHHRLFTVIDEVTAYVEYDITPAGELNILHTIVPPPLEGQGIASRKRWIGFTVRPQGYLVLDDGARRAVESAGRSLLPIGIVEVLGNFKKGDVLAVRDRAGVEFARGLSNYSSDEVNKIKGLRTDAIAVALGIHPYDEVIHRDNIVVTSGG